MRLHLLDRLLHLATALMFFLQITINSGHFAGEIGECRRTLAVREFRTLSKLPGAHSVDAPHRVVNCAKLRFHLREKIEVMDDQHFSFALEIPDYRQTRTPLTHGKILTKTFPKPSTAFSEIRVERFCLPVNRFDFTP